MQGWMFLDTEKVATEDCGVHILVAAAAKQSDLADLVTFWGLGPGGLWFTQVTHPTLQVHTSACTYQISVKIVMKSVKICIASQFLIAGAYAVHRTAVYTLHISGFKNDSVLTVCF